VGRTLASGLFSCCGHVAVVLNLAITISLCSPTADVWRRLRPDIFTSGTHEFFCSRRNAHDRPTARSFSATKTSILIAVALGTSLRCMKTYVGWGSSGARVRTAEDLMARIHRARGGTFIYRHGRNCVRAGSFIPALALEKNWPFRQRLRMISMMNPSTRESVGRESTRVLSVPLPE
jgi:hypothetical protein